MISIITIIGAIGSIIAGLAVIIGLFIWSKKTIYLNICNWREYKDRIPLRLKLFMKPFDREELDTLEQIFKSSSPWLTSIIKAENINKTAVWKRDVKWFENGNKKLYERGILNYNHTSPDNKMEFNQEVYEKYFKS